MTKELYKQIKESILTFKWEDVLSDYKSKSYDGFFIVKSKINIVDAAYRTKIKDEDLLLEWFNQGIMYKIGETELSLYNAVPEKVFYSIEIDSYRFIQEKIQPFKNKIY